MLAKGKNKVFPCSMNSVGALDSALFLYSFLFVLFIFHGSFELCSKQQKMSKAAINVQRKGFPESLFCRFLIQPGVPNDDPNHNEAITKNTHNPYWPDAGPLLAEELFFVAAHCSSKMSSKQAQDMAGCRFFLNELLELKVGDVKKTFSCETSLKNDC